MFGIGWTEMLVLGVVALIVIGPKDLPVVMNRLGKMVNSIRRMGSEFQRELNKATGLNEITDLRRSITEPLKQTAAEIRSEFNKPTATGGVEPSGIVKPKDPKVESVVDEINERIGVPAKQPYVPFTKEAQEKYRAEQMAEAVKKGMADKADKARVESPAPPEATVPPPKKPRAPRKPKSAAPAEAAPVVEAAAGQTELVLDTPEPAKKPRKPRAKKPVSEA
jgi:sec-independent protein translocase protein TatB